MLLNGLPAAFLWVLERSGTACVVIALVLLARLALKRAPKVFSYVLWAAVLLRLLCPVTLESPISFRAVQRPISDTVQALRTQTGGQVEVSGGVSDPPVYSAAAPEAVPSPAPSASESSDSESLRPERGTDWIAVGAWVWLVGAAGLAGYSAVSLVLLRRRLAEALPLAGENGVWLADRVPTPFVLGLLRPRIYLPSALPEGERDYVLLHERTHIRRLDHVTRALAWLAVVIHWFNPLVWLAFHLAGKDMEMSCDEAVLRRMGRDVRADYSTSLLRLSCAGRFPAGPLAFGDAAPRSRIRNVLSYKKPAVWVVALSLLAVTTVGIALATDPLKGQAGQDFPVGRYIAGVTVFSNPSANFILPAEITLSEGGELSLDGEDGPTGALVETGLGGDNFLSFFGPYDGLGWAGGRDRSDELRRENAAAWEYVSGGQEDPAREGLFWCLLRQEDGALYLAHGRYALEDTEILWVLRLEELRSGGGRDSAADWLAAQTFEPDLAGAEGWNASLRATITAPAELEVTGRTGGVVELSVDAKRLHFAGYGYSWNGEPPEASWEDDETLAALEALGSQSFVDSSGQTEETRQAVARYLRVTRNGQEVTGVLQTNVMEGEAHFTFVFDQPLSLSEGDVIAVELGPPERFQPVPPAQAAYTLDPYFGVSIAITGLDCQTAYWYEREFEAIYELPRGARGSLEISQPRFLGEWFAGIDGGLTALYCPDQGGGLLWIYFIGYSYGEFIFSADLTSGAVMEQDFSEFTGEPPTQEELLAAARMLAGVYQGALDYYGSWINQAPEEGVLPFDRPLYMVFYSGAGGWSTQLELHPDGSFKGEFFDGDLGVSGPGYQGTNYVCQFHGSFGNFVQTSAHAWSMTMTELTLDTGHPVGEEWIEGGIRYVSSNPYGLEDMDANILEPGAAFMLYAPEATAAEVNADAEFASWLRRDISSRLGIWALRSLTTNYGFVDR